MTQPPADPPAAPAAPARRRIKGKPNGRGWGGPAKGMPARGEKQPPFEVGIKVVSNKTPEVIAVRRATRDSMLMVYETICDDKNAAHMAKIMAADKWLDRKEGKAIARTISLDPFADVTIEQLDALLAAAERADAIRLIDAAEVGEE